MLNVRHALRALFKSPFVTVVAIVSLALGIGANAAIFSVFHQILLRPLPVPDPARLVNFQAPGPNPGSQSCSTSGPCSEVFSYSMFKDLERGQTSFTGIAAHRAFGANVAAHGQTRSSEGSFVSGSYFNVLGIRPALGRFIGPDDDAAIGGSRVAVLNYSYWQRVFGADPGVLHQTMIVNGQSLTIIGIAPRGFDGTTVGSHPDVFVPMSMMGTMYPGRDNTVYTDRRQYLIYLFGRLKPGVSLQQARAAINQPYHAALNTIEAPLQQGMSDKTMALFRSKKIVLVPGQHGQSTVFSQAKTPLMLLMGVTLFVLLIACANIANLLLARGAARAGEMAVRLSIGAGRWQLVGQLLFESCLLALIGGVVGLGVARITLTAIASIMSQDAAAMFDVHLNGALLLFSLGVTAATGIIFGLFPALHSTRPDLIAVLRGQSGQPSGGRGAARFRTTLATVQIGLSMALLVSAGLFIKSLLNVARVDLGLHVEHIATFGISPDLNGYKRPEAINLYHRLSRDLATLPGVNGVTSGLVPLLAGNNWGNSVNVEGFPTGPDVDNNSRFNAVAPDYFAITGMKMLAGREFTPGDRDSAARVAVVNQAFARKFKLGTAAVGKHMDLGNGKHDIEIVGLVQDAKYSEVKDSIPPVFFLPLDQNGYVGSAQFYVSTSGDPATLLREIPRVMARIDPNLPLEQLRTMPQQVRENIFLDRFIGIMSSAFAVLATLLAAIGLYGVLAYTFAQRTREIGLRMALGAAPAGVRSMVLRQVGTMTLIGGGAGLLIAVALGRLVQSLLFQMKGWDPVVLALSALLLAAVAFGAGLIPAQRAASVDPMRALRYE